MNKFFLTSSSSFFFMNFILLLLNNNSTFMQSLEDASFNTCAYLFMAFFIRFNLTLFYDPEEDKLSDDIKNVRQTATEKIMIKMNMSEDTIKNVKEIIKR